MLSLILVKSFKFCCVFFLCLTNFWFSPQTVSPVLIQNWFLLVRKLRVHVNSNALSPFKRDRFYLFFIKLSTKSDIKFGFFLYLI